VVKSRLLSVGTSSDDVTSTQLETATQTFTETRFERFVTSTITPEAGSEGGVRTIALDEAAS
jgi:hypothetical protein